MCNIDIKIIMKFLNILKNKKVIAWSFYDFANQPFSTIIVTFIYSAFYVKEISYSEDIGTYFWSLGITITSIFVAFLSPFLGAISDKKGNRHSLFIFFSLVCSIFTMTLYFPNHGDIYLALFLFVIANIAFEFASVFCNSYLTDLSNNGNIGKVSGYAWGLGFIGGLLALLLCFIFFDLDVNKEIKKTNILVGIWYIIFSMPAFLILRNTNNERLNSNKNNFSAFLSIKKTIRNISSYKSIYQFLIARLFYNDGLVTIFTLGGIYAVGTLEFTFNEVLTLGIVLNICACVGSFFFGYFEDILGVKKILNISLVFLILATIIAFFSPSTSNPKQWFWCSCILIGLMSGPNQSCSRSLMGRLIPDQKKNEFFGFYALTGKATAFLGPLLFGIITRFYNQQLAILIILLFFILGTYLFNKIKFDDNL